MALEFASKKETFPNYRKFETTLGGPPVRGGDGQNVRPVFRQLHGELWLTRASVQRHHEQTSPVKGVDFFPLSA